MCRQCRSHVLPRFGQFHQILQPFGGRKCRNCGTKLRKNERFSVSHGKPYCPECIEEASTDDLVRFCETTWDEWIVKMGISAVSPNVWKERVEWK